ncbi:MAG TPA: hypothetical protein VIM58_03785 [Candidatus Methylacidiphilales bacterium]
MRLLRPWLCAALLTSTILPAPAATWNPDPSLGNPATHRRLYEIAMNYLEQNYDPDAGLVGVPTRTPPNKKGHTVRESTYYAYGLLLTGDPEDRAKALPIVRKVLSMQNTVPGSPLEGAFLWYAEDKWETVANPDLNSAAFIGMTLISILDMDRKHPFLDADLRAALEASCRLSVKGVMRRNVEPSYTNISILSTALAAAGTKLLGMTEAGVWAEKRLDEMLRQSGDGANYEYLSPTYGGVDIHGAYMAQRFAFSDAFAEKTQKLIDQVWMEYGGAYHAATYQLVGPYNRSYGEDMLTYAAGVKYDFYLALDGDYPLPDTERDHAWDKGGLVCVADLPIKAIPDFKAKAQSWRELDAKGPGDASHPPRHLSQYQEGNLCLGTVNLQDSWTQKRNLVAFWRSAAATPEGFRIGFCFDESNETLPSGFPRDRALFHSKQAKGAALVALSTSTVVPGAGASQFVFAPAASLLPGDGAPFRVQDGDVIAYVYPVSNGTPRYEGKGDERRFTLSRSWLTADVVGSLHVLSYVLVVRPANQPPPSVSGTTLTADANGVTASAVVDGVPLTLTFKN